LASNHPVDNRYRRHHPRPVPTALDLDLNVGRGGWRALPHHTGVRRRRGLNLRMPHSLRFSFQQRVRVLT
jgi:hypothetical protein